MMLMLMSRRAVRLSSTLLPPTLAHTYHSLTAAAAAAVMSTPAIQQQLRAQRQLHASSAANGDLSKAASYLPLSKLQPLHQQIETIDDGGDASVEYEPVVLVACGSYSPITNMHLRIFEQARNYLQYDTQIYFTDSQRNKQKKMVVLGGFISPVHDTYGKKSLIDAEHRISMCELSVADHPWLGCSRWEVEQPHWTPTAEVLDAYSKILNDHSNPQIRKLLTAGTDASGDSTVLPRIRVMLLCGADLLYSIKVPDLWSTTHLHSIFGIHGTAVIEREGMDLPKLIDEVPVLQANAHNICTVPQTISNTISSTSIRELLGKGQSVRYLIPESVMGYIADHDLYGVKGKLYRQRHLNAE